MIAVGDVVGSYTILAHLRSGGMADLYLARREGAAGFRRLVAVKVIHRRHAEDAQLVRMFLDEARISARIDHPNVVHVEDLGEVSGTYFLVMEYVHGCSLAQLLKVLARQRRRLSPTVAVALAARVAEGLHAAHETTDEDGRLVRLVHRDVSPQNILLSHKGHVKLIDFGVAKATMRTEETHVAMLKGKLRYMPPEQATTGLVDSRSDVYSLGIVLWEMLTMRRLFNGTSEFDILMQVRSPDVVAPSAHVPDLPPELDRVILAALAKKADDRPPTAKHFRRMLARAVPEAMALDSAHLAELIVSTVGDELESSRHELPEEVSRVLQAEHLRVTDPGPAPTTEDAVEVDDGFGVMTVDSELVQFEEDELDRPDLEMPLAEVERRARKMDATRPGRPMARPGERARLGDPLEDAEPTEVDDVPEALQSLLGRSKRPEDTKTTPNAPPAHMVVEKAGVPIGGTTAQVRAVSGGSNVTQIAVYLLALLLSLVLGAALVIWLWPRSASPDVESERWPKSAASPNE